jgi:hypothetical protein
MRTIPMILALAAGAARAHPGHAEPGLHWHAFDAWGWALALALGLGLAAAGLWLARRK